MYLEKRRKRKRRERNSYGILVWNAWCSKFLLRRLNKEINHQNTYKFASYERVAKAINQKFIVECTASHVDHRLKIVKKSLNIITALKGKRWFGWDANLRMIIVRENEYDEEILVWLLYYLKLDIINWIVFIIYM